MAETALEDNNCCHDCQSIPEQLFCILLLIVINSTFSKRIIFISSQADETLVDRKRMREKEKEKRRENVDVKKSRK
jgi:hypothetical protein